MSIVKGFIILSGWARGPVITRPERAGGGTQAIRKWPFDPIRATVTVSQRHPLKRCEIMPPSRDKTMPRHKQPIGTQTFRRTHEDPDGGPGRAEAFVSRRGPLQTSEISKVFGNLGGLTLGD